MDEQSPEERSARKRYGDVLKRYFEVSDDLLAAWRELTKLGVYMSPPPSPRFKLPDERAGKTFKIDIMAKEPFEGYLTTGNYTDGHLGEIFMCSHKMGSFVSGIMDAFATTMSVGLQHGVPIEWYIEKFKHTRFEPAGMTKHPEITQALSVLDYIMKWLELRYTAKAEEAEDGSRDD
jgi:ribonucleoside-diphosphate reductase alpha chain